MRRSIRWRLLLWFAGMMILVMVGFSSILYWSAERSIVLQMDTRLEGAVRYLDAALRAFPINELLRPNPFSPPGGLPREGTGFASKEGPPRDLSGDLNEKRPPVNENHKNKIEPRGEALVIAPPETDSPVIDLSLIAGSISCVKQND